MSQISSDDFDALFAGIELRKDATIIEGAPRPSPSHLDFSLDDFSELRGKLAAMKQHELDLAKLRQAKFRANHEGTIERKPRRKKVRSIAVLDVETDPFDNIDETEVYPFTCALYSDEFPVKVFWNEDYKELMREVYKAIEELPGEFLVYAHNGGKFDWRFIMFLLKGTVSFKGSRLMSAHIGHHELRDSVLILPDSLDNITNKGKMEFDYSKMRKENRNKHRVEIITYMIDDCQKLHDVIKSFVAEFGTPLTIGQASMKRLKEHYHYECLSDTQDHRLREYFYGGRVECLRPGISRGSFALYDVNSMYPSVMALHSHPISRQITLGREVTENTRFITLECTSDGAFASKDMDGSTTFRNPVGSLWSDPWGVVKSRPCVFHTTIWEYRTALQFGLLSDVNIIRTIDFDELTTFEKFVIPYYERRFELKKLYQQAFENGDDFLKVKYFREMLFLKFLLNNAYGKFAQNPRRFKEYVITEPSYDCRPDDPDFCDPERIDDFLRRFPDNERDKWRAALSFGDFPAEEHAEFFIWERLNPSWRFNHVGTAASITGAARASLLDALCRAKTPLYCDTDSIVCEHLSGVELDKYKLGAWDKEAELDTFIGCGKKLYGYHRTDVAAGHKDEYITKCKGTEKLSWDEMLEINSGKKVMKKMKGPTIYKDGSQKYIERSIRRTA